MMTILSAAGNNYDFDKILEALRLHYPPGMTLSGQPLSKAVPTNFVRPFGKGSYKGKGKGKGGWRKGSSWQTSG